MSGCDLHGLVQLHQNSQDVENDACNDRWRVKTLWSVEDLC